MPLQCDTALYDYYSRLRVREKFYRLATTAVAKKLCIIVWAMMKLSGYKVDAPFNTWSMEADAKGAHHWFKQISQKDTRAGDIVVVNAGGEGHTAILREHFHGDPHSSGNTTKIVNDGGCENNANNNLFGRSFYPGCAGGRVTFMRPVGRHK